MPSRPEGSKARLATAAASVVLALAAAPPAFAQSANGGVAMGTLPARAEAGSIVAENGSVVAMAAGTSDGSGSLTLLNRGKAPDRLVALSSPSSREVRVRQGENGNREADGRGLPLELPAGSSVTLQPDGMLRLAFIGTSQPFAQGSQVALTLTFETAGRMALTLPVLASAPGP